jgi:hypothetical protein
MAKIIVLVTTIACALALAASSTAAVPVSGTYTVTDLGAFTCVPLGARVTRCDVTGFTSVYDGALSGVSTVSFVEFIDCARSRAHGYGLETFVGDVADVGSGTLTWEISFQTDFDCNTFAASGFVGSGAITGASGALVGLHGRLSFTETTYEATLR